MSQIDYPETENVQVLLAEYTTLRSEAVVKGAAQIQVAATGGTVIVATIGITITRSFSILDLSAYLAAGILLSLIFVFLVWAISFLIGEVRFLSIRISELENLVNDRVGEKLLIWESERGIQTVHGQNRIRRAVGLNSR